MKDVDTAVGIGGKLIAWLLAGVLLVEALATTMYVRQFASLFASFESPLPSFTQVILAGQVYIWALPLFGFWWARKSGRARTGFAVLGFLAVLGVLWIPAVIYGLYLPVTASGTAN